MRVKAGFLMCPRWWCSVLKDAYCAEEWFNAHVERHMRKGEQPEKRRGRPMKGGDKR